MAASDEASDQTSLASIALRTARMQNSAGQGFVAFFFDICSIAGSYGRDLPVGNNEEVQPHIVNVERIVSLSKPSDSHEFPQYTLFASAKTLL